MIQTTFRLLKEYNITCDSRCRIFVDGANPSFIRALKDRVDEDSEYEKQLAFYKKSYASIYDLEFLQHNVFVILVSQRNVITLQRNVRIPEWTHGHTSTIH